MKMPIMKIEIEPVVSPKGFAIQVVCCLVSGIVGGLVAVLLCR